MPHILNMKPQQIVLVIVCILALLVSGWRITSFLRTQAIPEASSLATGPLDTSPIPAPSVDVPGLGLGGPEDRKWIEYYYRNPSRKEAATILRRIAGSAKGDENSDVTAHFFSMALHGETALIAQLEAQLGNRETSARDFLKKVAGDAGAQGDSMLQDQKGQRFLWAEYLATGDMARIDAILSVFDEPESDHNRQLQAAARDQMLKSAPFHADVYHAVLQAARLADGERLAGIQAIADRLRATLQEPVGNLLTRASNLANQGDCAQARHLVEEALRIFPDSVWAQETLARVAEIDGKLEEAQTAMRRAVAIYPMESGHYYALARICFLRGDYEAAARGYEKAIELGYPSPAVWHAVARAYQEKGDRENAIRCFKEYLKREPHGPNEFLVKGYLSSVKVVIKEDPNDIVAMLLRADYATLENRLATILHQKQRNELGASEISAAYETLCTNPGGRFGFETFMAHFERWASQRPESHFAHAAYGIVLTEHAWNARGDGWASTVTDEGWKLFNERLEKARKELERSYALDPTDPIAPAHLIRVALGLGLDRNEMEKQFQRGKAASPDEYDLYEMKLNYLKPRWHGSEEEMLGFAREVVKNAPEDSMAPLVLAKAHWDLYDQNGSDRRYFQRPGVWEELKPVYVKICKHFPKAMERQNWFALTAFYAGDYETVVRETQTIGDNWSADGHKFMLG